MLLKELKDIISRAEVIHINERREDGAALAFKGKVSAIPENLLDREVAILSASPEAYCLSTIHI